MGGVLTVTGGAVINGGLEVQGSLTTIETTNLQVEDKLIQQTTHPHRPLPTETTVVLGRVMTGDSTQDPHIFWRVIMLTLLVGLQKRGTATTAGRIMVQTSAAADPTAAPVAGVGSMYYASTSKSMFVYVDS